MWSLRKSIISIIILLVVSNTSGMYGCLTDGQTPALCPLCSDKHAGVRWNISEEFGIIWINQIKVRCENQNGIKILTDRCPLGDPEPPGYLSGTIIVDDSDYIDGYVSRVHMLRANLSLGDHCTFTMSYGRKGESTSASCNLKDTQECEEEPSNCSEPVICTAPCQCDCNDGYDSRNFSNDHWRDGYYCYDTNECEADNSTCPPNAQCINTVGSYSCECSPGFTGDGLNCQDIDECKADNVTCPANAQCINIAGSYSCECSPGFTGDGLNCTDINESSDNPPVTVIVIIVTTSMTILCVLVCISAAVLYAVCVTRATQEYKYWKSLGFGLSDKIDATFEPVKVDSSAIPTSPSASTVLEYLVSDYKEAMTQEKLHIGSYNNLSGKDPGYLTNSSQATNLTLATSMDQSQLDSPDRCHSNKGTYSDSLVCPDFPSKQLEQLELLTRVSSGHLSADSECVHLPLTTDSGCLQLPPPTDGDAASAVPLPQGQEHNMLQTLPLSSSLLHSSADSEYIQLPPPTDAVPLPQGQEHSMLQTLPLSSSLLPSSADSEYIQLPPPTDAVPLPQGQEHSMLQTLPLSSSLLHSSADSDYIQLPPPTDGDATSAVPLPQGQEHGMLQTLPSSGALYRGGSSADSSGYITAPVHTASPEYLDELTIDMSFDSDLQLTLDIQETSEYES